MFEIKTYSHLKNRIVNPYAFFYSFGWILTALCEQLLNKYE